MARTRSETSRFNFTKASLAALEIPPPGNRVYHYDIKKPGLAVCVTDRGVKTFCLVRRINGKPERVRLGRFGQVTVEQAGRMADIENGKVARGVNPQEERRQARADLTVADAYSHYMSYAAAHLKRPREVEYRYRLHLSRWRGRKLKSIRRTEVQALHRELAQERGQVTANRAIDHLRAIINRVIDDGKWSGKNPAAKIERFKEHSRERFAEADELPRLFEAIANEPDETFRDFFLLALFTGARRSNLQAMRWADIALDRRTWEIPGTHAKADRTIAVPLPAPAVEILERRRAEFNGNEWVFPSHGRTGHLREPWGAWQRICERAGISNLQIHDLRRTLGSWQAMGGTPLQVIGRSLGHRSHQATLIYARLGRGLDQVRESVEGATAAMIKAAGQEGGDDE